MTGPWDEITFTIGAILVVLGVLAFRRTKRFIARCLVAEGTIVDYRKESADDGPDFYFSIIRFVDASGATREIGGSHGLQEPPAIGTVHSITYDPTYPSNAWITGTGGPWAIPWVVLIAGISALIAGVVMRVVP